MRASSDGWGLRGSIQNVDLRVLGELFKHMFGGELQEFTSHTIEFSSLELSIGTDGLTLAGAVTIDHYTSAEATVTISQTGLSIQGSVGNVGLAGLELERASLNVSIGKVNPGGQKSIKTVIEGKVSFAGMVFDAGLYWKKVTGQPAQWTVYGEYAEDLMLSTLAGGSALKGTFLDLSVKHVAFLASNTDASEGLFVESFRYPIKKGRVPPQKLNDDRF